LLLPIDHCGKKLLHANVYTRKYKVGVARLDGAHTKASSGERSGIVHPNSLHDF
jgi:hypothetical protein